MADYIKQIEQNLQRLKVSHHDDPERGLKVERCFSEYGVLYTDFVEVSNNYGSGIYGVIELLFILDMLTESSLSSVSDLNIWYQIWNASTEAT